MRKGISPLIASVLLVAFTMAVAAILVVWITGFTQEQTGTVGERGTKQAKCAYSVLNIDRDDVVVSGTNLDVVVSYSAGVEKLNITGFVVRDNLGVSYTNITALDTSERNLQAGQIVKFSGYTLSGSVGTWAEVRVTGLCQNEFAIVGSVKA